MANSLTWLAGASHPTGANMTITVAGTEGGTVKFGQAGGNFTIPGFPTNPITLDPISYTAQISLNIGGATEGKTSILTATPYDANGINTNGSPIQLTVTYYAYDATSGQNLISNRFFVKTPADQTDVNKYWRVYMQAKKAAGGTPLGGALVQFTVNPLQNIAVYTDEAVPKLLTRTVESYWVSTDPTTGRAALRIVTDQSTKIQYVGVTASMQAIDEVLPSHCYFASNDDPADQDAIWVPPSTQLDDNNRIDIPDSGRTFNLDVSVNGETDPTFKRFIIFNDDAAIEYENNNDGTISIPYSILNQSQDPQANAFTYARQTPSGNVRCTKPWKVGVDGSRANLPDATLPNRLAPAPVVDPSPGPTTTIGTGTINAHQGLQLNVSDFKATLLTGIDTTKPLTVVFNYYMNGYNYDGEPRASQVYASNKSQYGITSVTISYDAPSGNIKFSKPAVVLPEGLARWWGRDPFTNDKKKVGFEYVISDGTGTWYSYYDDRASWYYIDTGTW